MSHVDSLREFQETHSEVDVLRKVEEAAREVTALLDGSPARWTLDGRKLTADAGDALISLHAYLNDAQAWRS